MESLQALADREERAALDAESKARAARRRRSLLLKLCDAPADMLWEPAELFDAIDAALGATSSGCACGPACALGVCFNLVLVFFGQRPGFCVQLCDFTPETEHVYSRALKVAELLPQLAVVECTEGNIIVRSERAADLAQTLADAEAAGTLSTAVGKALGYAFAGELKQLHRQSGRFSVVLYIEQSPDESLQETTPKSCVMAMIGTRDSGHGLEVVMEKALALRDVASSLGRGLRVTFQVSLFDEDEFRHRPKKSVTDGIKTASATCARALHSFGSVEAQSIGKSTGSEREGGVEITHDGYSLLGTHVF
jgi:hypothetical protein